ncbi:MAG: NAD-dependent dihydropyrimidine dehydrogenase subunit PreA, partial [Gemmatimonadetes bacterium]|nr:NAD-dependent dihydropyrimidine dehydrogenase subunit PreA [Gemmatimonadota bacterium]
ELITDRPLADNLREIADVKRRWPDRAVVVSLMFDTRAEWNDILRRCEDTGCDGVELNFGCPHGMCERGMGSAVGQEPNVLRELVSWVAESTSLPILAKLTPNVTDIREPARAAREGGAHAVSLINTVQSVIGVDLDRLVPFPRVGDASTHGGYCGPAVKPIALRMVADLARDAGVGLPISGIGGIGTWRDAAEFLALGASTVQVCTAVMHHGFRIVEDLIAGLSDYLDARGLARVSELTGAAVPAYRDWGDLDLNYRIVAEIHEERCIGCQLCWVACHDGAHQCIHLPGEEARVGHVAPAAARAAARAHSAPAHAPYRVPWVDETECVGCNLCALVCPVDGCITMEERHGSERSETWNDRVRSGRANPPGGLRDLD